MSIGRFFIGLDLGQSHDFTAMAVLERSELTGDWDAAAYAHRKMAGLRLRHLERIALGTPYPEVVERVTGEDCAGDAVSGSGGEGATGHAVGRAQEAMRP